MEFREDFVRALELLGRAFSVVVEQGHPIPVLVGGGAVEYYTGGAVVSGDFDVVTPMDVALMTALLEQGFLTEDRPGHLLGGFYHPVFGIGVEIVGRSLFEGRADPTRVAIVEISNSSEVAVVSVEDLIADRMGQYCSTPQGVKIVSPGVV